MNSGWIALPAACVLALSAPASGETLETLGGAVDVRPMVRNLDEPWAIAFLPSGGILISERGGELLLVRDGQMTSLGGLPEVFASGQGGLLDVMVPADHAQSREIFLTYSEPRDGGAGTALAVGKLDEANAGLSDLKVIFRQNNASSSEMHFGSRVVEAADGSLFLTLGERRNADLAQSPGDHDGKIIHINRDGTIPAGNPYAAGGGLPEIWSLGHRNPQGAALDGEGRLWTVEHGAKGGDEVNHPEAGRNYGWPVISYGTDYDGSKIGVGTDAPGMEQPAFYWDPSIAPSGLMIYSGKLFPLWAGDFFVGSLKFDMISRLEREGGAMSEAERLFDGEFGRIRDIREAPDGSIWFLSVGDGVAYRIAPLQ